MLTYLHHFVFFKDFFKKNLLSTRLVVNAVFFVNVDIASFFKKNQNIINGQRDQN
jgi:hypothetical protein